MTPIEKAIDALYDCASGLKYIRERYGDLEGVGFVRALEKYEDAYRELSLLRPDPQAAAALEVFNKQNHPAGCICVHCETIRRALRPATQTQDGDNE